MSDYLSFDELTLHRDRGLADLIGSAVLDVNILKYSYLVEGGGETVLRVTNDYTLSQAFLGSFGSFSLGVVDAQGAVLLAIKHSAGLFTGFEIRSPDGQLVARISIGTSQAFFGVEGANGELLFAVDRKGALYPTYVCQAGDRLIGEVDAKFNGLSEVFNSETKYEVKVAPGASPLERLLLLCAGVFADVTFHSS
jgi:hypothetical protein